MCYGVTSVWTCAHEGSEISLWRVLIANKCLFSLTCEEVRALLESVMLYFVLEREEERSMVLVSIARAV